MISFISFIACVFCIIYVLSLHQDLNTAHDTINELNLQKDETTLQAKIDSLTDDNIALREQLYALQNTAQNDDSVWMSAIENDIKTSIQSLINRDCSSADIATVTKAAYESLRSRCTKKGFQKLVPNAVYESLDSLPKDDNYIVNINQWADDFQIWTKLVDNDKADVFIFYHYNSLPQDQTIAVVSNYAMYVTMLYDANTNIWQIDDVHFNELLQSKFTYDAE